MISATKELAQTCVCLVHAQVGEFEYYRDQLWTAPELLRFTSRPINGTQKADVYSFAIVIQEIMFRAAPYFIDVDTPKSMYSTTAVTEV